MDTVKTCANNTNTSMDTVTTCANNTNTSMDTVTTCANNTNTNMDTTKQNTTPLLTDQYTIYIPYLFSSTCVAVERKIKY